MAKYCIFCGAELQDEDAFCAHCGNEVSQEQAVQPGEQLQEQPEVLIGHEPMVGEALPDQQVQSKKPFRVKWWMILIAAVLVIAVLFVSLWPQISLRFMPKLVLTQAVVTTTADLTERLDGNPLMAFGAMEKWTDGYTMDIGMDLSLGFFGGMRIGISTAVDNQAAASATVINMEAMGESSISSTYVNKECIVFGIENAGQSGYYGVTFDTLEEDLKKSPAFADADQETIDNFKAYLESCKTSAAAQSDREEINQKYVQVFTELIKDLTLVPGSENYRVDGKIRRCSTLSVSISNAQLADTVDRFVDVLEQDEAFHSAMESQEQFAIYGDTEEDAVTNLDDVVEVFRKLAEGLRNETDGEVTFIYRIYRSRLVGVGVKLDIATSNGTVTEEIDLALGLDPAIGDIILTVMSNSTGEQSKYTLTMSLKKSQTTYSEQFVSVSEDASGNTTQSEFAYTWKKSKDKLEFAVTSADGEENTYKTEFEAGEDEIRLELPDLLQFVNLEEAGEMGDIMSYADLTITIELHKGAVVEIPEYINLDQWDPMDMDFWNESDMIL